jgi:speckle-type POZ protein
MSVFLPPEFSHGNTILVPSLTATPAPGLSGSDITVDGYSRTKGLGNGKHMSSETFVVGGHSWGCLWYFPDGYKSFGADWISLSLHLDDSNATEVRAQYTLSLLDQDSQPMPSYTQGLRA